MSKKTLMPGTGLDLDNPNEQAVSDGPVECLGKTFANDAERREYYLQILAEKLKDPEFRKIEGFPIGEDIDILNLSDPPYYTACPNPFIADFISHYGRPYDSSEIYKREPYAADVSEGKNDPIYNAHSYHTKVPHKAIMRYILHYTNPGDVVFDGFCGTGMTGVAAQMCGDRTMVESLGYRVLSDGVVQQQTFDSTTGKNNWTNFSRLGTRYVVLSDLSPIASFITANFNEPVNHQELSDNLSKILDVVENDFSWMYLTLHEPSEHEIQKVIDCLEGGEVPTPKIFSKLARVNYTVWSDVFSCSECSAEIVFWDNAINFEGGGFKDSISCPVCASAVVKGKMDRIYETKFDAISKEIIKKKKEVPVLINYSFNGNRYDKKPDPYDKFLMEKIESLPIAKWVPSLSLPKGDKTGEPFRINMVKANHFYTQRNLIILSELKSKFAGKYFRQQNFVFTSTHQFVNKMCRLNVSNYFSGKGGKVDKPLDGTLYVPSISLELNVLDKWKLRSKLDSALRSTTRVAITQCGSSTELKIPAESMDYIFLDPPFGSNLMYSELNYLWESWIRLTTDNRHEAIENRSQDKKIDSYRTLITTCFKEAYRLLKPGRWLTVEFSNTKASVWNSIQSALNEAGFIVANVSMIDKKKGSFKSVTNTTSVKQDLVISAYKPNGGFEGRFIVESSEDGVWDFVRTHLNYLPIVKIQEGDQLVVPERDSRILYDQVVAYFVRKSRDVPLSSRDFQAGLLERFAIRDGMIFLPEQVAQYDKARMTSTQLRQLTIFVDDEASAIEWLRQLLNDKPQTYQDVHPKFIHELSGWKKAEMQLELATLLEQNFLKFDGTGQIPAQIHSYLSTNFKEMRNLAKDDSALIQKAKDRWYVPNPDREEDLQKLRDRSLLKQFEEYKNHSGKKLKLIRMEAVRAGFKKAWIDRDYKTIIEVAEKIPEDLLQEDQKLLMWYDQAQTRYSDSSLF